MKEFKYDVSIIIPVYNTEKYIDECVESIINQKYDFSKIQVILINDGSSDNSLNVCKKYESYKNVKVIDQKNSGVSAARNKGLESATGKYLMFVDSDDFISNTTVEKLVNKMENHYNEVDLFVYPRYTYVDNTKKKRLLNRYVDYKEGIYDVDKYIYFVQPTLNVITKNQFENNEKFDEEFIFHEDEDYTTKIIMKKRKFGYVDGIEYDYRIHEQSTTNHKSNPYYCFDNYITLYERFINKYLVKNKLHPYIQSVILNDIKWRIKSDCFYPYHYTKEEYKKALTRIKNIFKYIENSTIAEDENLNKFHKIYFLKFKKSKIDYFISDRGYEVSVDRKILERRNAVDLYIEKFKVFDDQLYIVANIKSMLLEAIPSTVKPIVYLNIITNDGKKTNKKVSLYDSNFGEYKTKIKTNDFYGFNLKLDIKNVKRIEFCVNLLKQDFSTILHFSKKCPFRVRRKWFVRDNTILRLSKENNKNRYIDFYKKGLLLRMISYFSNNLKTLIAHPDSFVNRIGLKNNKIIWLYNDNKNIIDNAYYQFMYDINKKDGIERYYVFYGSENQAKESNLFNKYLDRIVYYGTKKHKRLFINSSKVISSFHDINIYSPFKNKNYYYTDILKYEFIYLQHGILHAYMPWEYSNEKNNDFDKVVISTNFEKNSFINKYNYSEYQLICTGMPRLDNLKLSNAESNKILYAPSWRKNLVSSMLDQTWQPNDKEFLNSKFYKESLDFLNSSKLQEFLEKNNLVLEFKNHPIFEKYNKFYNIKNKNVKIISGCTNPGDYKLVITDYSSFVFDYVYLNIPILYFTPDYDLFLAGVTHHYKKLDLPLEQAFGPVAITSDELLDNLIKYSEDSFKLNKKYQNRYKGFFFNISNKKESLYKKLIKKRR